MVFGRGKGESIPLLNIIVGIVGIVLCIFNCFVVCKHPSFQKGGEFYNNGVGFWPLLECRLKLLLNQLLRSKQRVRRRRSLLYDWGRLFIDRHMKPIRSNPLPMMIFLLHLSLERRKQRRLGLRIRSVKRTLSRMTILLMIKRILCYFV